MFRNLSIALTLAAMAATLPAQERRSRIDVQHYVINAEINENTQTLAAKELSVIAQTNVNDSS